MFRLRSVYVSLTFEANIRYMSKTLKIGVWGGGHLGKIHIRILKELEGFELVGFYDLSPEVRKNVSEQLGVCAFDSSDELLEAVDCADIVTPTLFHFEYAAAALRKFKHVFVEKPFTENAREAKILLELAHEAKVLVQVGHVERFNPAFQAAFPHLSKIGFIEGHRLAQFNPRGTDVSVVQDLMIHDIDIVLSVVKSNVKKVYANGVAIVSDTPDICNARIEFENGCVANLTASRMSMKNMRKMRFFQKDAYVSVDFLEKQTEILKLTDVHGELDPFSPHIDLGPNKPKKQVYFNKPDVQETNAIQEELKSFYQSIQSGKEPAVSAFDGLRAVETASMISEKVENAIKKVQ